MYTFYAHCCKCWRDYCTIYLFHNRKAKKKIIRTLNPQIGENLFDGGSLWTLKNLGEISEHTVKNEDTNKIHQVRIKFTREVPPGDYQWLQLMVTIKNILKTFFRDLVDQFFFK